MGLGGSMVEVLAMDVQDPAVGAGVAVAQRMYARTVMG